MYPVGKMSEGQPDLNGAGSSGFGHSACKGGQPAEEFIQGFEQKMTVGPRH
jgi:hypothetical protein